MKKIIIGLSSVVVIMIVIVVLVSSGGSPKKLEQGEYIYGKDVPIVSSMYNVAGPGEITVVTQEGEEAYYRKLKEGEEAHEHYIPLEDGDTIKITDGASLEFV